MFPSQRGHFFPNTGIDGKKSSTSSYIGQRMKSPPLGVSAIVHPLTATRRILSQHRRTGSQIPSTLSMRSIVTMSKSRRDMSTPKFSLTTYHGHDTEKLRSSETTSQVLQEVSPSRVGMSRIPSSWTNQPWTPTDPYFQLNRRHAVDINSMSSTSKVLCSTDVKCRELSPKIQEERALVTKLCEDALKTRRDASAFYSNIHDDEVSQTNTRLSSFDPKNNKGRICEFMLKLITQRHQLLQERRAPFAHSQNVILKVDANVVKPRYTPLFCLDGKALLGKPENSISFPNTFAPLTELWHPKDEPQGYRRFCTLVNLNGFQDKEIFLRVTGDGNCLVVDGARLKKNDSMTQKSRVRVLSTYIDLPKGVYPEHLKIGRSSNGILVIQESWKF